MNEKSREKEFIIRPSRDLNPTLPAFNWKSRSLLATKPQDVLQGPARKISIGKISRAGAARQDQITLYMYDKITLSCCLVIVDALQIKVPVRPPSLGVSHIVKYALTVSTRTLSHRYLE